MSVTTDTDDHGYLNWVPTFLWVEICSITHLIQHSHLEVGTGELIHQQELGVLVDALKRLLVVIPGASILLVKWVKKASSLTSVRPV